jgi:uncharacterized phiE125 gp8 family phage protein
MAEYTLSRLVAPTEEPVTLAEALTQCHADAGVEDDWFEARIRAGRQKVEDYVKLSLMPQTWVLLVSGDIPNRIYLPRSPVQDIESVTIQGDATASAEKVLPLALINDIVPAWLILPDLNGLLRIEYRAGCNTPSDIPQPLKDAILLYVSHSYENRAGEADIPKAFYDLIEGYRLHTWTDRSE